MIISRSRFFPLREKTAFPIPVFPFPNSLYHSRFPIPAFPSMPISEFLHHLVFSFAGTAPKMLITFAWSCYVNWRNSLQIEAGICNKVIKILQFYLDDHAFALNFPFTFYFFVWIFYHNVVNKSVFGNAFRNYCR